MPIYYLVFLLCGLFLETNTVFASKKHRFKPFKTKQQRTQETNQQLERAAQIVGNDNWFKRQAIIRHAVMHRVNPDALRSMPGDKTTPLYECVVAHNDEDGLQFADFLLQRGANARALHRSGNEQRPLIYFAETVAMAQLLVNHGAGRDVQAWGPELLNGVWHKGKEAALIPFFVTHGARTGRFAGGEVPLKNLIEFTHDQPLEGVLTKIRFFMVHGAPLSMRYQQTLTVPRFIKREIEQEASAKARFQDPKGCDQRIVRLQTIRQTLIEEEQKRNIRFCMNAVPYLLPVLRAIVGSYSGPGKNYQEFENESIMFGSDVQSKLDINMSVSDGLLK